MKTIKASLIVSFLIMLSMPSFAQEKWSVELRPGVNIVTSDIEGADLKTGFGAEFAVGYRFMPHLGAYAGWGWNQFKSDIPAFPGSEEADFELTGYTFGLQFIHPIGQTATSYLVRLGGIYNHIEVENSAGDISADSGHGLGWEIGAGLNLELGSNWHLRPQLGYRALSRDLEFDATSTDIDLNYFSFGIGMARIF